MAFFYPIHHIGFVYPQYLSYPTATDSAVVHFDRQLSGFFRVCMPFRVYGIIFAALLTLAALAPRGVIPCLDLVFYLSTFWASFPCLFCPFSHVSYSTIKSLFWTLPKIPSWPGRSGIRNPPERRGRLLGGHPHSRSAYPPHRPAGGRTRRCIEPPHSRRAWVPA